MQVLGIHIDSPFVRAALIQRRKNKIEIQALQSAPLADPTNVKQLYISSFKGEIASAMSGKDLLIRSIEVPEGKGHKIEKLLAFQSEASSAFSQEDILHVPYLSKGSSLSISVLREHLAAHLQELCTLDIDPDRVGAAPLALVRYIQWKLPTLSDAFLIDLGSNAWTCTWMEKGALKKSYAIEGGIERLLASFWEDQKKFLLLKELENVAKKTDLSRVAPPDLPLFYQTLSLLRQELAKVVLSFHRTAGALPVIFTGRIDAFCNLRTLLIDSFRDAVSAECNSSLPIEELKYAIAIGVALDSSLQLRQQEFFPAKLWNKAGKRASLLLCSSLISSALLLGAGSYAVHQREASLLSHLQPALCQWDPSLTSSHIPSLLSQWNRSIQSYETPSPFIPRAPKVAEVLSWLTQHPLFCEGRDPLQIRSIHYRLLDVPHLGAIEEPYRANLEIEFQAMSPLTARKFHEFLLKGEGWVDGTEEISWEVMHESYRTAFFLKNRGPHAL